MRKVAVTLCTALALTLCGGCAIRAAVSSDPPEGGMRVYYAVTDASGAAAAVGYEYCVPEAGGDVLRQLMDAALAPPEDETLASPYPYGVSLRSALLEEGVLRLDFSEQYGELSGVDLTVANYCLTLTLCQADGVDALHITVEGRELPYFSARELRAEDVVLTGDEEKPVYVDAALWFARTGAGGLEAEVRQVLKTEDDTSPKALLDALIAGPEGADKLYTLLPAQTQVRSASVEDGVCTVDFSGAFLDGTGEDAGRDKLLLYAVVNTLAGSLENVQSVRILTEGEPVSSLGGVPLLNSVEPDFSLGRLP